jgi:MFS family permease
LKIQKHKLYLYIGRVLGGIDCGLIGVLFTSWLVPTIGQNGVAVSHFGFNVASALVSLIFATSFIIRITAEKPYLFLWGMVFGSIIDIGILFIPDVNPWLVVLSGNIFACGCGMGFFFARNALINRKIQGDELTQLNNVLMSIVTIFGMVGIAISPLLTPSIMSIAYCCVVLLVLSVPINFLQIRELLKLPDIEKP